jgi:hypothetical protein
MMISRRTVLVTLLGTGAAGAARHAAGTGAPRTVENGDPESLAVDEAPRTPASICMA